MIAPEGKVRGGAGRAGARSGREADSPLATCQLQQGLLTEETGQGDRLKWILFSPGAGQKYVLEPMIQSEVSQKEKDRYCILMHTYGISKDGTNNPTCRAVKETQT